MVGGNLPTQTIGKVNTAVNQYINRNPNFIGNVVGAPHSHDQAELVGKATSDLLGGKLKKSPAGADTINRTLATSAGIDPKAIFKMMQKKMGKS